VFGERGEDAWERLRRDRPDLVEEFLTDEAERRKEQGPFFGTPCFWFDPVTRGCRHYDWRPAACRAFALGGDDCRDARRRAGIVEGSDEPAR
jgi:Fe-S-cluster containining protein